MLHIHQSTKSCKIRVCMSTGNCVEGCFHTPASSSDATRPFDAIRDFKGGYLLLSDATVTEHGKSKQLDTVMVRVDNISHVELPDAGWEIDDKQASSKNKVGACT